MAMEMVYEREVGNKMETRSSNIHGRFPSKRLAVFRRLVALALYFRLATPATKTWL
jgi:hypothetical protein